MNLETLTNIAKVKCTKCRNELARFGKELGCVNCNYGITLEEKENTHLNKDYIQAALQENEAIIIVKAMQKLLIDKHIFTQSELEAKMYDFIAETARKVINKMVEDCFQ